MNCEKTKGVRLAVGSYSDYCHWPTNLFTEEAVETIKKEEARPPVYEKETFDYGTTFAGNKDELVLRAILLRAEYRCECDGSLCRSHEGRCETMHVSRGGKSPLLLQPKDAGRGHSEENSLAMCAFCATACTVNKMNVQKKKKKKQQNDGQLSII